MRKVSFILITQDFKSFLNYELAINIKFKILMQLKLKNLK